MADVMADAVLSTAEDRPSARVLSEAARAAVRSALGKALGPLRTALLPLDPTTMRLLGMLFCPDISEHPEVEALCVAPLSGDILSESVTAWVRERFASPPPPI